MHNHKPGDVIVIRGHPYQLLSLMATGGQGAVFDARDNHGEHVAIKLVPAAPRHRLEVKLLASLASRHVVRLIDAGSTRTTLFLVLERIEGIDLKTLIRLAREIGRPIPPMTAAQILHQACLGLAEATELGEVESHGDIKPGNLILDRTAMRSLSHLSRGSGPQLPTMKYDAEDRGTQRYPVRCTSYDPIHPSTSLLIVVPASVRYISRNRVADAAAMHRVWLRTRRPIHLARRGRSHGRHQRSQDRPRELPDQQRQPDRNRVRHRGRRR